MKGTMKKTIMIISNVRRMSIVKYEVDAKIVLHVINNINALVDEIAETGDARLIGAYDGACWVLEKLGIIEEETDETSNY